MLVRRRRLVIHPQKQNEYAKEVRQYKPLALDLPPVSELAGDVLFEGAIAGDGDSAFYQIPLPREVACYYRGRTKSGRLFECTTFLMGHTSSCEVCQLITAAAVGHQKYVKKEAAIDESLNPRIWIDSFNVAGPKKLLQKTIGVINNSCAQIKIVLKEKVVFYQHYNFVALEFDYTQGSVRCAFKIGLSFHTLCLGVLSFLRKSKKSKEKNK